MKRLWISLLVLVSLIAVFFIFIFSGAYDISATKPHYRFTRWIINTLVDNSVKHHAKDIKAPNLNDTSLVRIGFSHYNEMCSGCHSTPGVEQNEVVKSFYPRPPKLVRVINEWTPSELFWMTKNGIKMSGMPAFGTTHSDKEIWAIVAFMQKLPAMTKEQYENLVEAEKNKSAETEQQK